MTQPDPRDLKIEGMRQAGNFLASIIRGQIAQMGRQDRLTAMAALAAWNTTVAAGLNAVHLWDDRQI